VIGAPLLGEGTRILRAMELLQILPTEVPGTLRLVGELDISNVEPVQARLEQEFTEHQRLTLDASELAFMDSQGLRMLIALGQAATVRSSVILVLNCSKAVRRSLDVAVPQGIPGVEIVDVGT
jgi:anti-anti-sigma factor